MSAKIHPKLDPILAVPPIMWEAKNIIEEATALMEEDREAAICQQIFAILLASFAAKNSPSKKSNWFCINITVYQPTDMNQMLFDLHTLLPDVTLMAVDKTSYTSKRTFNDTLTMTEDRLTQYKTTLSSFLSDEAVPDIITELFQERFDEYVATQNYPLMAKIIQLYKTQASYLESPSSEKKNLFSILKKELETEITSSNTLISSDITPEYASKLLFYIRPLSLFSFLQ